MSLSQKGGGDSMRALQSSEKPSDLGTCEAGSNRMMRISPDFDIAVVLNFNQKWAAIRAVESTRSNDFHYSTSLSKIVETEYANKIEL